MRMLEHWGKEKGSLKTFLKANRCLLSHDLVGGGPRNKSNTFPPKDKKCFVGMDLILAPNPLLSHPQSYHLSQRMQRLGERLQPP